MPVSTSKAKASMMEKLKEKGPSKGLLGEWDEDFSGEGEKKTKVKRASKKKYPVKKEDEEAMPPEVLTGGAY